MTEQAQAPDLSFLDGAYQDYPNWYYMLVNGDHRWRVNNSTMQDYSRRAYIGGTVHGLEDIIVDRVGHSEDNVGLDLAAGSRAQALRDLLDSGVLGRALATNYQNRMPRRMRKRDDLDHIKGNLVKQETWRKIIDWQKRHAPEGFDLVMHRPVGGLQDLGPRTYHAAAHILLGTVKPGGMMFTQVPRRLVNLESSLDRLCRDIRGREDVEGVITTGERPSKRLSNDESDLYAVILKG